MIKNSNDRPDGRKRIFDNLKAHLAVGFWPERKYIGDDLRLERLALGLNRRLTVAKSFVSSVDTVEPGRGESLRLPESQRIATESIVIGNPIFEISRD